MITARQKTNGKWELYCKRYDEVVFGADGYSLEFPDKETAERYDRQHPEAEVGIEEAVECYDDEEDWNGHPV
jgi:hypothetical protein